MRFPSIADVAAVLRDISANVEGECDVRLCIYEDGQWIVRHGLVDYDPDHSPYCGASSVPGVVGGKVKRFDSVAIARELIEQCRDMEASSHV